MRTSLVSVPTSELRDGDVVLRHGLRILIDRPFQVSACHGDLHGGVRYSAGLILNLDEVLADDPGMAAYVGIENADRTPGEPRWTIQGNDLATWAVEVR